MVVSFDVCYVGLIGHVLHVWNLHMSFVRMRVHMCVCPYVFVCVRVYECVRVCQARQVYRHGEFTDTSCLKKKNQKKQKKTETKRTETKRKTSYLLKERKLTNWTKLKKKTGQIRRKKPETTGK